MSEGVGVFNEVWHRVWPLEPRAYARFVDYYADHVVAPNRGLLDVLGGFRFVDGDTNADLTLYRYASIADIERVYARFGQEASYLEATEALLSELTIEETRTLALPLPCATAGRLDRALAEGGDLPRTYVIERRTLPGARRDEARALIGHHAEAVEKSGSASLVAAYEPIFGDVTRATALFVLDAGARSDDLCAGIDAPALEALDALAPVCERRRLEPLRYSRLR